MAIYYNQQKVEAYQALLVRIKDGRIKDAFQASDFLFLNFGFGKTVTERFLSTMERLGVIKIGEEDGSLAGVEQA